MGLARKGLLGLLFICLLSVFIRGAAAASFLEWDLAAQNQSAALYIHPQTTEIAVHSFVTGKTWFSNPQGRDHKRSVGQEIIAIRYDTPVVPDRNMNSFDHSVKYGQFEISSIPNGVRVEYLLGQEYESSQISLPQMIKADRFENLILSQITDPRERSSLERYYTPVSLEKPTNAEKVNSKEVEALEKQLFGDYILVAHTDEYCQLKQEIEVLELELAEDQENRDTSERLRRARLSMEKMRGDLVYRLLEKFTGYAVGGLETRTAGYRHDVEKPSDLSLTDFKHLVGEPTYLLGKVPPFIEKQLTESLVEIGYGIAELTYDHLANRLEPPLPNQIVFRIPIEYTLDGADLVVRIPMGEVEYPKNVFKDYTIDFDAGPNGDFLTYDEAGARESYPLISISLMRFFGAGGTDQDGYLFVPDGSGGLIYFNNGKSRSPLYSAPVYGPDPAIPVEETSSYTKQINRLPVFGITHNNGGVLAIIEDGEALASIRADIARDSTPYNTAYTAFAVTPKSSRRLDQHTQITVYQRRMYEGNIQVRYTFLEADEADYSGMANRYRMYLVERGILQQKTTVDVPFFLEVTGAISAVRPVLGVPMEVSIPLTTFAQAEELVELLVMGGIQKPHVRYSGWLQGGVEHVFPDKLRLEGKLGTQEDLERLNASVQELGGVLYPDVRFLEVYKTRPFGGFTVRRDAARAITGLIAQVHPYDPVLLRQNTTEGHYLLTPTRLDDVVDGFLKGYNRYHFGGISLSQFGLGVHSDYRGNEEGIVDRQQTVSIIEQQLRKFENLQKRILIDGGNVFALSHADGVVGAPLKSTKYDLVDEEVPFYAMVVRGYLDFAGPPLNLSSDWRRDVLKAVEAGAGIYFSWVYEHAEQIKGTKFAYMYDVSYDHWFEQALTVYHEVVKGLQGLQSQTIKDHTELTAGVYKTSFSSGDAVIVNYNDFPVEIGGYVVESLGFTRIKGGDSCEETVFSFDFE
ncbi:MAG: hypothetical protein GX331_00585 [Firmicutes bacterium]|nr:hypothetical protein [Bacillota bacterium]